jgi:peptide chain release factor subunit 1
VISAISKVKQYIDVKEIEQKQGYAFFADETEAVLVPYDGTSKIYHCGNAFVLDPFSYLFNKSKYLLMAIDLNHCTIGILNGKKIQVLWDKEFYIQGKSKPGGQSAARYERLREEQKKQMFKACAAKLQEIFNIQKQPILPESIDQIKSAVFKKIKVTKLRR